MVRSGTRRSWAPVLFGLCLVAAIAGQPGGPRNPISEQGQAAVFAPLSGASDTALLPALAPDDVQAAAQFGSWRALVLPAVLGTLLALPPLLRRRAAGADGAHRPLWSRRYAIVLRAPPLHLA